MNAALHRRPATYQTRVLSTPHERAAVARLRYEVYVEEMGRQQAFADHVNRELHEPLDAQGVVLGTFTDDGTAIGTIRLNPATADGIAFREIYGWEAREQQFPGQVFLGSKLIVAREFRGTLVSVDILRAATRAAVEHGWRFCFLDANAHLIELYSRLGFVARSQREHPLFGSVTIMEWDMQDHDHMKRTRSPLLRELVSNSQAA